MNKYIKYLFGILLFCILSNVSFASAQQTDPEVITAQSTDFYSYVMGRISIESCDYAFTNKSEGKRIPLRIDSDGILMYCFSSEKIKLVDGKKGIIKGKTDDEQLGGAFTRKEYDDHGGAKNEPVYLLPVKKNKTYFVQFPDKFTEEKYGVFAYVFPKEVRKLKHGEKTRKDGCLAYLSEGCGKYVYYPFVINKKSLAAISVDPMFFGGGDRLYFKVQKKIKGKWKNIVSVRNKRASYGQISEMAPYGFSKGKYRLGVKAQAGQIACIMPDIRVVNLKNPTKKRKAAALKKGKEKKGIFVWEDKKAHWYKVVKTKKNKVKRLEMHVSAATDKTNFVIYKKGTSKSLKTFNIRGRERTFCFLEYTSKSYALKENGTYYIKVSKANKKTNGAYKIGVK